MVVHLVDGTYELFRHFYGLRRFNKGKDSQYGAVIGVLRTVLQMIEGGATHLGVATDHVIESFRNELWADYKTGTGLERALVSQFHPLEEALVAMGVAVWPMVELEADDALATAAARWADDPQVETIFVCSPDKDLAQCVREDRVVQILVVRSQEGDRQRGIRHRRVLPGRRDDGPAASVAGGRAAGHGRHGRRRRGAASRGWAWRSPWTARCAPRSLRQPWTRPGGISAR